MSTYAIGDVQGCFEELQALLKKLNFSTDKDRLLFCGDLVNRGPRSLDVLRFVRALGDAAVTTLGNHDLHLLALAEGAKPGRRDTLDEVLAAPDRDDLIDWLSRQLLAYQDRDSGVLMVHAGLPPQWSVGDTLAHATELSAVISHPRKRRQFFAGMYGDQPDRWSPALTGLRRKRFIVNALTRMRYCTAEGKLDLHAKGAPGTQGADLLPWFAAPNRRSEGTPIVFGHWSTLGRVRWQEYDVYGLDTGCIWGGRLTALRLDDRSLYSVPGKSYADVD